MRRVFSVLLCLCICVVLLSCCSFSQRDLDDAWEDGHVYGYEAGYESGHEDGFDEGYDEGYNEAELEYEDKYSEGHNDGYQAGATYACLFYNDVDRAFQSAYKGSAWYTFIDAYDQYISNIYDNDETRSDLFWALVSVKSGDGLTAEEKDLLISTFGSELFINNDIELIEKDCNQ